MHKHGRGTTRGCVFVDIAKAISICSARAKVALGCIFKFCGYACTGMHADTSIQYVSIIFTHLKTGTAQTSAKIIDIGRGLEFMSSYCGCQSTTNERLMNWLVITSTLSNLKIDFAIKYNNSNIVIYNCDYIIHCPPPRLGWDSKNQKCCETKQLTLCGRSKSKSKVQDFLK